MSLSSVGAFLLKIVLLPAGVLACGLVAILGRQTARLWLPVVFALPAMTLSSPTACVLFALVYIVNAGWA
jgi:hypothetical protein